MLDWTKLNEEFTKVLNSYTDEEFNEWYEMDKKRMALADREARQVAVGKLNGSPHNTAKSKGVSVNKITRKRRATVKA